MVRAYIQPIFKVLYSMKLLAFILATTGVRFGHDGNLRNPGFCTEKNRPRWYVIKTLMKNMQLFENSQHSNQQYHKRPCLARTAESESRAPRVQLNRVPSRFYPLPVSPSRSTISCSHTALGRYGVACRGQEGWPIEGLSEQKQLLVVSGLKERDKRLFSSFFALDYFSFSTENRDCNCFQPRHSTTTYKRAWGVSINKC